MESKPLIFISTPSTVNNKTRCQTEFDSRQEDVVDRKIRNKLENVVVLNNRGKNIRCKIFLQNESFEIIPRKVENNYLYRNDNKIHLSKIKEVEIKEL